jgi:hypothetical protein
MLRGGAATRLHLERGQQIVLQGRRASTAAAEIVDREDSPLA